MAFTRKMLEAMSIPAEQIESIMEAHIEVVTGLKAERDSYREQLESIDTTKDWKVEYDTEHAAFEAYKAEQNSKDSKREKEAAFIDLLAAAGVAERYRSKIVQLSQAAIDSISLDSSGKPVDRDALIGAIKQEWDTFIPSTHVDTHTPATPPSGVQAPMSRDEIFKRDERGRFVLNEAQRREALMKNHELKG